MARAIGFRSSSDGRSASTAGLLLVAEQRAVDDRRTRAQIPAEVGSCSAGLNRKPLAHVVAGSWLSLDERVPATSRTVRTTLLAPEKPGQEVALSAGSADSGGDRYGYACRRERSGWDPAAWGDRGAVLVARRLRANAFVATTRVRVRHSSSTGHGSKHGVSPAVIQASDV